jgi:putative PIN family toxin of toxin-antitoxin system
LEAVIRAGFDSNVVVSGAGWRGESHLCLKAMARRRVRVFTSRWIPEESRRAIMSLPMPARDPMPVLLWFSEKARIVSPMPTGKPRSRDRKDHPVLGTALAAKAGLIVTYDQDLLVLRKPFGIEIVRPRELLARLQRPI